MKKTLLIAVILLLVGAATVTFADMSFAVYMTGSLYGTNGFVLNNQDQKDPDLIQVSVAGDVTGASFRLWSNLDADASIVHLRKAVLWWKPMDMLKLSVGNVSAGGYTEQLDWWKVPCGASLSQFAAWENRWSSAATGDKEGGVQLDINPMDNLSIVFGLYPGYGMDVGKLDPDLEPDPDEDFYDANTAWGILAKYNIEGFGSVLGAYRDDGFDDFKIGRIGFDVNAVENLYAFLTGIMYWDDHTVAGGAADEDQMMLRGFVIDNYVKYSMDAITLEARFPITMRLTGQEGDDSYMTYRVRGKYAMDGGITPYLNIENGDGVPINFAETDTSVAISIRPGMEWSVENLWGDIGLQIDVPASDGDDNTDEKVTWSIPFKMRVSW
jgi:hypothetical protein